MNNSCYTGTIVPPLIEEVCNGEYISTNCVKTPSAIVYLDLPEGSTQTEINVAIVAFLLGKDAQIENLQSQINELELRIIALENP